MSMNEFEGQLSKGEDLSASSWEQGRDVPADFSEDDVAFAQELSTLFALDKEEMPPYFVQTLLEPHDQRFQLAEHGFEHKVRAHVFRRLKLKRRLFQPLRPSLTTLASVVPVRRSSMVLIASCLLFLLFTVAFTSQSFVEGVAILLHSTRSGVYQVHNYPEKVSLATSGQNAVRPTQINLPAAEQLLHFPMYWPQALPNDYLLEQAYLYQESQQTWTDGPILELHYDYTNPRIVTNGTGDIAIREFKPGADVLQLVQSGAAHSIQTDTKGIAQAIYVDGQWVSPNRFSHRWQYGGRSELIYQRDGVVFWIVGDQRDGIDQNALLKIAQSLQVVNTSPSLHVEIQMTSVTQLVGESSELFAGDIIAVLPDGNLAGPYLVTVGPDQPSQEKPVQKHSKHTGA